MDGKWIFNLEDENCDLPTEGYGWEILKDHVKAFAKLDEVTWDWLADLQDDDIIEEVECRGIPIGDLFDDDDIVEYILDAGIPVDVVYAEDDILESNCVKTLKESLLEKVKTKTEEWEATAGGLYRQRIAELEEKVAELEEQVESIIRETLARHGRCDDGMGGVFEFCDTDEE